MEDWKKVLMYGAFGAAAYLLISGKRGAGFAAAGVGLAALASDHPERFEEIWNQVPDYLDRGHRVVNGVQTIIDRVVEHKDSLRGLRASS